MSLVAKTDLRNLSSMRNVLNRMARELAEELNADEVVRFLKALPSFFRGAGAR